MNKYFSRITLASAALSSFALAQSLYDIAPTDEDASESSPIQWLAGVSVGYDSNSAPLGSEIFGEEDSLFVSAFIQGSYAYVTPRTTLEAWARVGVTYYLDEVESTNLTGTSTNESDNLFPQISAGLNWTNRISERLRFSSRNYLAYSFDTDFDSPGTQDVRSGNYFRWSTDNSLGYRWTERLGTISGVRASGVIYDDIDGSDYNTYSFYNQFRYRVSPATVLTASYRYGITDRETGGDSNSHYITGGLEHRFSPNTVGVFRGGVQVFDPDNGSGSTAPYVEAALRSQVNEQFGLRSFVRYGIEGFNTTVYTHSAADLAAGNFEGTVFNERQTLRVGLQGNYQLSPKVALFAGGNVIYSSYDDAQSLAPGASSGPSSYDEIIYSVNAGLSYALTDNVSANASVNFTMSDPDGDAEVREYDRTRVTLGLTSTF